MMVETVSQKRYHSKMFFMQQLKNKNATNYMQHVFQYASCKKIIQNKNEYVYFQTHLKKVGKSNNFNRNQNYYQTK